MRTDPIIKDAMKHLIDLSEDSEARELVRIREKAEHDWASGMATARKAGLKKGLARGLKKGRAEGEVEGLKKGRAEGKAEGRAEGKAEGRAEGEFEGLKKGRSEGEAGAKRQVLQAMLLSPQTSSLPDQEIARIVDLSVEEVSTMRARFSKIPRG